MAILTQIFFFKFNLKPAMLKGWMHASVAPQIIISTNPCLINE